MPLTSACCNVTRRVFAPRVLFTLCVNVSTQAFPSYIICTASRRAQAPHLKTLTLPTISNPGPTLILRFPCVHLNVCPLPTPIVEQAGGTRYTLLAKWPMTLLINLGARRLAGQAVLTLRLRLNDGAAVFNRRAVIHLPLLHRNLLTCPAVPLAYRAMIFAVKGLNAFERFIPSPPAPRVWYSSSCIWPIMLNEAYLNGPLTRTTLFPMKLTPGTVQSINEQTNVVTFIMV